MSLFSIIYKIRYVLNCIFIKNFLFIFLFSTTIFFDFFCNMDLFFTEEFVNNLNEIYNFFFKSGINFLDETIQRGASFEIMDNSQKKVIHIGNYYITPSPDNINKVRVHGFFRVDVDPKLFEKDSKMGFFLNEIQSIIFLQIEPPEKFNGNLIPKVIIPEIFKNPQNLNFEKICVDIISHQKFDSPHGIIYWTASSPEICFKERLNGLFIFEIDKKLLDNNSLNEDDWSEAFGKIQFEEIPYPGDWSQMDLEEPFPKPQSVIDAEKKNKFKK